VSRSKTENLTPQPSHHIGGPHPAGRLKLKPCRAHLLGARGSRGCGSHCAARAELSASDGSLSCCLTSLRLV